MKFKHAKIDDERTKTYFAYLPVVTDAETRWWEDVTVKQRYVEVASLGDGGGFTAIKVWKSIEFVDEAVAEDEVVDGDAELSNMMDLNNDA